MDILGVIIVLLVLLLAAAWSSARSYFIKGRLAGMEEATLEIIRGVRSHYELAGQLPPDDVTKAAEAVRTFARAAKPSEEHRSVPGPALDLCRRRRCCLLAQGL
jgi:hypothetical protein